MKTIDNKKGYDKILRRLFRKAEVSYTVSDISKALGPMIDLVFISQFIGTDGVTVIGYVSPLIMFFELVGTTISSGARNKVSSLIGAGKQEEADRRRARTYGLLVEELAIFLSEHGFVDEKPHNIYARLVAKDADLIIRLRDDCRPLNLLDYYEAVKEERAKTDEPGLSIIMKIARDVSYCASFGVNNLIVRF